MSIRGKERLSAEKLSQMNPWDIAQHYGIGYSGDINVIEHEGLFYEYCNWVEWGYASCVEFWRHPEHSDRLVVSVGIINRPDDMSRAFNCCGISSPDDKNNVFCQIEAATSYSGFEEENSVEWDLSTTSEVEVWKQVRPLLESLESK